MNCYKKRFEFKVGKYTFQSKTELNQLIKHQIKNSPRNIEITNEFLLSVINELHSDVKKRNYKVTKIKILDWQGQTGKWEFCRERFRGGIMIIGFFEPINEWHGVTLYLIKETMDLKKI